MIEQMQCTDEGGTGARSSAGMPPPLRVLPCVTVLAEADETEAEALDDWARGLDWVQWLFSRIRQGLPHLHFAPEAEPAPKSAAMIAADRERSLFRAKSFPASQLLTSWQHYTNDSLRDPLGNHLIAAWHAARTGDIQELLLLDQGLSERLPLTQVEISREAGRLLLQGTDGARYQGLLGRLREAQKGGITPGHFLTVWAAVGNLFQLSLANVIAEYLRLEWTLAARQYGWEQQEPEAPCSIAQVTSRLMHENSGNGLCLLPNPPAKVSAGVG